PVGVGDAGRAAADAGRQGEPPGASRPRRRPAGAGTRVRAAEGPAAVQAHRDLGKPVAPPARGVRDRLLRLGGDSLLAVRMLAQVEQVYGRRLSAAALFARPTVESLARAIMDHDGGAPSPLVQVQAGTFGLPFFYLHGDVGGGGLYCTPLARQ